MGRLVRSKKEYVCSNCSTKYIRWQGICDQCKNGGTLQEVILVPPKPRATRSQRSINERSKRSERSIARRMQDVDGRDPEFSRISSSTGRVGHITSLQFDAVSRTYVTENKNRAMPTWLIQAWIKINQRAIDFNKHALLHIEPSNMPKTFPLNGEHKNLDTLAVIGQTWHELLLIRSKKLEKIENLVLYNLSLSSDKVVGEVSEILREE